MNQVLLHIYIAILIQNPLLIALNNNYVDKMTYSVDVSWHLYPDTFQ